MVAGMIPSTDDEESYRNARMQFGNGEYSSCLDTFLRLSAGGDARATFCAAAILDRGGGGVKHDWVRARSLYKLSLGQRFTPAAALSLARMRYLGKGGDTDYFGAFEYYKLFPNDAFSNVMLGTMKLNGHGCQANESEALRCFDRAWSLGHPLGLKNAAILRYKNGNRIRGVFDFIKASVIIVWVYGIKKKPIVRSMT